MPINPITFAHSINENFLRHQLTSFPIADPNLSRQTRELLRGSPESGSPLVKGPYVSLAKAFRLASRVEELVEEGLLHPAVAHIAEHPQLFAHQEAALRAVKAGRHCLISTGTGSGKTEAFLYPIIDHCLRLRDTGAPEGITSILVYPMNALALDQRERLRRLLKGTGVSFGMYVGSTPVGSPGEEEQAPGHRGPEGHKAKSASGRRVKLPESRDKLPEERVTEREIQERPPRILLTNVKQLELLLTRSRDLPMFVDAPLRFLVLDEAHTYSGVTGAEVACLIRRVRALCAGDPEDVICIGTSATLGGSRVQPHAAVAFAQRLFGVDPARAVLVQEEYAEQQWREPLESPPPLGSDAVHLLDRALEALAGDGDARRVAEVTEQLTGRTFTPGRDWSRSLYEVLSANAVVKAIYTHLAEPVHLSEAVSRVARWLGRTPAPTQGAQAELLAYLALGAAAESGGRSLLRPKVHFFVRGLEGAVVTFADPVSPGAPDQSVPRLFLSADSAQREFPQRSPYAFFPLSVCASCGQHYMTAFLRDFAMQDRRPAGGDALERNVVWEPVDEEAGGRITFTDRFVMDLHEENQGGEQDTAALERVSTPLYLCRHCGSVHRFESPNCVTPGCARPGPLILMHVLTASTDEAGNIIRCPVCGQLGRRLGGRSLGAIKPLRAATVADVHTLAQDMVNSAPEDERKLIIFTDNRQDAAFQAGWMQDHARRYKLRHLIHDFMRHQGRPVSVGDIQEDILRQLQASRDRRMHWPPKYIFRMQRRPSVGRFKTNCGTSYGLPWCASSVPASNSATHLRPAASFALSTTGSKPTTIS